MKLPLLMCASPKMRKGATVPVHAGKWRVIVEGLKTSRIHIHYGSLTSASFEAFEGKEFTLEAEQNLLAHFTEVGDEQAISLYLERLN